MTFSGMTLSFDIVHNVFKLKFKKNHAPFEVYNSSALRTKVSSSFSVSFTCREGLILPWKLSVLFYFFTHKVEKLQAESSFKCVTLSSCQHPIELFIRLFFRKFCRLTVCLMVLVLTYPTEIVTLCPRWKSFHVPRWV